MLPLHRTPPQLLPGLPKPDALPPSAGDWRLIADVRGGCEKSLAHDLLSAGVPYFLPMEEVMSYQGHGRYRQRRRSWRVLFPGYLFVAGDDRQITRAFDSCWMGRLERIVDQKGIRAQLAALYEFGNLPDSQIEIRPDLAVGKPVLITAGPLRGIQGIIERREGQTRFSIRVTLLNRTISVVISDPAKLEAVTIP